MSLVISKVFTYDTDAGNYIQAVEAADGQALEAATRQAINNFVIGCKQDGIWSAIKASCILAGARTLSGALVPLVGAAPTNFNFVSGDYNRKTGLKGNATNKYLTYGSTEIYTQSDRHLGLGITEQSTVANNYGLAGCNPNTISFFAEMLAESTTVMRGRPWGGDGVYAVLPTSGGCFTGISRLNASTSYSYSTISKLVFSSQSVSAGGTNLTIFARNPTGTQPTNPRIAFYSGGTYLDLAKLDARVTALINAFGAAIP